MADTFLAQVDETRVVAAIAAAEKRSRGEIRIHVTAKPVEDPMKAGAAAFERLGMTATAERNGVLIFVASTSRKFAVLGDSGVTSRVGTAPLDAIAEVLGAAFREGRFTDGLVTAVERAGELLAEHFPPRNDGSDRDELANTISRG